MAVAILLIGAVLRFQNIGAIEHNVDHAYPIWQALMTLDRGAFPVTAQGTSVLFANPALTGYLFIPFVALTRSPIGAYLFVIALNTLALWLVYRSAAQLLDENRALIAMLLMAINPWVIEYSRTTWVQSLIPFFAALLFWLIVPVLLGTATHPKRRLLLALITLTAMTQTYLLGFAILAPILVLLVLFRQRLQWRPVIAGALIFVAATGIYAAGLAQNSNQTTTRIEEFATGQARLSDEAWRHALRLITGVDYAVARGTEAPIQDSLLREDLSLIAHDFLVALLIIGMIGAVVEVLRRRQHADKGLIALVWFALPILMMTYVSRPVHPFYLLLTLPAGYILVAAGCSILLRMRLLRGALIVGLIALTALNGINALRYAEATIATPGAHGLTALPVADGIAMAHTVITDEDLANGIVIFANVDSWILNSLRGEVFPVAQTVGEGVTIIPKNGGKTISFVAENGSYQFADGTGLNYSVIHPPTTAPPLANIQSDKGITFLGAVVAPNLQAGDETQVLTSWRIDALPPERDQWLLGAFVHVYDATGTRVVIADGSVIAGSTWRLGDLQLVQIKVKIPVDAVAPFRFEIGQYDGVHNLNAIFQLPDGTFSPTINVEP
ncbi:MAG: hypothetical protein KF726_12720 [Anaerolineae bacterium]|nr:hypothetical protein [Anaerolineae bacterium]